MGVIGRLAPPVEAMMAIVARDWHETRSYRLRPVTAFLGAAFSLTLFYYLSRLVRVGPFATSDAYYAYAAVGLIILQMVNATLGGAGGLFRREVASGGFEGLLTSPFGPVRGLLAVMVFPVLNAIAIGAVMLVFAAVVFGLDVRWSMAWLGIPVAVLAALAFAPFALALLAGTVLVKQAAAGATWIVALVSLIAGLYFPTTLLPAGLEWASEAQPFTPAVDLLRNVLVGTPLRNSATGDLLRLAGFAVVLIPPALLALRAAVEIGRRRATILEF